MAYVVLGAVVVVLIILGIAITASKSSAVAKERERISNAASKAAEVMQDAYKSARGNLGRILTRRSKLPKD